MAKLCVRCEMENPDDAKYCSRCGRRMLPPEWLCPNCGNRCYTLHDYFDETLYRCPFCQRQFRREPDGALAPVAK